MHSFFRVQEFQVFFVLFCLCLYFCVNRLIDRLNFSRIPFPHRHRSTRVPGNRHQEARSIHAWLDNGSRQRSRLCAVWWSISKQRWNDRSQWSTCECFGFDRRLGPQGFHDSGELKLQNARHSGLRWCKTSSFFFSISLAIVIQLSFWITFLFVFYQNDFVWLLNFYDVTDAWKYVDSHKDWHC